MGKINIVAHIFLMLSLLSCAPKEEPVTREQALSKGYAMLDRKQYDEAIHYFANLAEQDSHFRVKLAWASAYAARAGIKIETIYAFVTAKNPQKSETLQLYGLTFDKQAKALFENLQSYEAVWNKIPAISTPAREDLQQAVAILSDSANPGVRLYSAALRAVILKSIISEGLRNWNLTQQKNCVSEIKPFWDWSLQVVENLIQLAQDLEGAYPSKLEFVDARIKLQQLLTQAHAQPPPSGEACF
ncbi:MAG TPA: hypothetical protein VN132_13825 [Bdellovibrio sp.]|nr:hypothetical protein [Bdellovibrio sp.]